MRLEGKVAMISGAGHGIGEAIARRRAADGACVLVCDIDEGRASTCARAIEADGACASPCRVDVRERACVEAAVATAVDRYGRLDVLVANAGIMDRAAFLDFDDALWDRVIRTNVAAFLASDEPSFTTGHVWAADGGFTIAGLMEG